jgi:hypothetical protein
VAVILGLWQRLPTVDMYKKLMFEALTAQDKKGYVKRIDYGSPYYMYINFCTSLLCHLSYIQISSSAMEQ